jgi:hypothetical protein
LGLSLVFPVRVEYTFFCQATIYGDCSRFCCSTATNAAGEGKVIATGAGAETQTYTPVAADGGKFLGIEITPASYDTVLGTPVEVGLMPRRTVTPLLVALV